MKGMIWKSAIAAFSMYSKIPMPQIAWEEKTTRYLLCWFPAVGLVIGAVSCALMQILFRIDAGAFLTGTLLTALPLLITGGIHLDGFLDTVDARASYAPREKKLEILKDPHVGAFAVIFCGLYLLVSAGAWSTMTWRGMQIMALAFPMERALSALMALWLPDAREDGSLARLKKDAAGKRAARILLIELAAVAAGMLILDWKLAIAAMVVFAISTIYYRYSSMKQFGGVTGDLAGWFLQSSELAVLLSLVIIGKLI
jgi:adenosylcobinamide-GDP ribazoletransferase